MSRARKNKKGSLVHQINERMKSMLCIGESRHQAKKEAKEELGYKNNRTVGIHNYNTFGAYKSTCKQFVLWAKEEGKGLRNIEDITEEHIKEFIQYREEEGYSSYTYSKDLAGLNKVFNMELTKKDCQVANRSYTKISNNREMKEHHKKINYDNYKDEIDLVKATGIRRSNVTKLTPQAFNYKADGTPYQVRLVDERRIGGANWSEKGGKNRVVDIPEEMQGRMKEIIDKHRSNGHKDNEKLFEHIPSRLGTHRFRQEFAQMTYQNYVARNGASEQYRGYDKNAIAHTSQALGHNRLDVVVYNYLSNKNKDY